MKSVYGQEESCLGAFNKSRVLNFISWLDFKWIIITCLPKIYTSFLAGAFLQFMHIRAQCDCIPDNRVTFHA